MDVQAFDRLRSLQPAAAVVLAQQPGRTELALTPSMGEAALCSGAAGHGSTIWNAMIALDPGP